MKKNNHIIADFIPVNVSKYITVECSLENNNKDTKESYKTIEGLVS